MEHSRKMVLVPQDSIGKLFGASETGNFQNYNKNYDNSKNIDTTQTPGSHLTRLDSEMSEILNSNEFDERTKWTKYQQTLQRYLTYLENLRNSVNTAESKIQQETLIGVSIDTITSSVPVTYRRKAELLLQYLKNPSISSRITWNNKGVVSIDNRVLDGSNIIDLINDVVRSRKGVKAIGRDHFSWFLRDIGMPLEFIGNMSLYKESQKFNNRQANKSVSSPHTSFTDSRIHSPDTYIHNSTPKPGNLTSNASVESMTDGDSTVINRDDGSDGDGSFLMTRRSTRQNTKKYTNQKGKGGWLTLSF